MRSIASIIVAAGLVLSLSSCQTEAKQSESLIKVYKYDGSLQCEGPGIALATMQKELTDEGIQVACAASSNDGMMRMMMCGVSTGNIHVFQINSADLSAAKVLGFELTSSLPEYQDEACSPAKVTK